MMAITLESGSTHLVDTLPSGEPDLLTYTSSENTRAALQAAYDAGQWETYTPPEPELEDLPSDWSAFRLALLQSETFRDWSERLPATWREDLKMAALAANGEALQSIYDLLAPQHTPEYEAAMEWQQIANENHIPITF